MAVFIWNNTERDFNKRNQEYSDFIEALEMVKDTTKSTEELRKYFHIKYREYIQEINKTPNVQEKQKTYEEAEKDISFKLTEEIEILMRENPEIIIIGEKHPDVELKGKDSQTVKEILKILDVLVSLGKKPTFVGIELTSLDRELLNTAGQYYYDSNKQLIEYCITNHIKLIAVAGDKNAEPGTQEFEDSIASKITQELMFSEKEERGLVLLGAMHAKKTSTAGTIHILPAAAVLKRKINKIKTLLHHNIKKGEPGQKEIEEKDTVAIQKSENIVFYNQPKYLEKDIGKYNTEDFDAILLAPTKITSPDKQNW